MATGDLVERADRRAGALDGVAATAGSFRGLRALLTDAESDALSTSAGAGTGLRRISSQQMLERVTPHLPDYGITRIANVSYIDRLGLPVHTAYKPNGLSLASGSGKGLTESDSAAGAAMEAIEQSVWEQHHLDVMRCSLRDLERQGLRHADPTRLARIAGNIWNAEQAIDWAPMTDLVTGDQVWVPSDVVGVAVHRSYWTDSNLGAFVASTNGLASGLDVAEATVSALFEVVERDAVTLGKAAPVRIDLDIDALLSVVGRDVVALVETIRSKGMMVKVFDVTHDALLPTFIAEIHDTEQPRSGVFMGYGNGFDVDRALVRAITEAVQARGLIIAGARDDIYATTRRATTRASSQLRPPAPGRDAPTAHRTIEATDVFMALEQLCRAAERCGSSQVLVHRLTDPGDPAQVVRVVVPGLEGYPFDNAAPGPRLQAATARWT